MYREERVSQQWLVQASLAAAIVLLALDPGAAQERPLARLLPPPNATQHQPDAVSPPEPLLISFDAVLRLARDNNGQLASARLRLEEAFAQHELASKRWLPDLTVGNAYYRHEGGIQDFSGQLLHSSYGSLFAGLEVRGKIDVREAAYQRIDAERKVWQQKGELSKLTSEALLDAAGTYVDLLAALASEAVSAESENLFMELAGLAQKLAFIDPGLRVEVVRIGIEEQGQKLITRKMREGASNAAAKLGYLLGLDPERPLVPIDRQLVPYVLVEGDQSVQSLVQQALINGPGVHELEGLLTLIEEARAKGAGAGRFIPRLEVSMAEGAIGAGPGAQMSWDNRWDLGLQLKWNLTELLTARERRRVADAQHQQAQLGYLDLRAKLTLGVREAREASLSAREQMQMAQKQITAAEESYALSNSRLKENIKGRSPSEVLMAIRTLAGARLNYLQAVRDYDKAQLRLFVLVGACAR